MTDDERSQLEDRARRAEEALAKMTERVRALEAAAPKRKYRYVPPPGLPSLRDQATQRGEPLPVGKTLAEIRELGWQVRCDMHDQAVVIEDHESPTGVRIVVPWSVCEALLRGPEGKELEERLLVGVDGEGQEVLHRWTMVTVGWLRKHKLAFFDMLCPNWAVVEKIGGDADGFLEARTVAAVSAIAPSKAAWHDENERRIREGLSPLKAWQRPTGMFGGILRRMKVDLDGAVAENAHRWVVMVQVADEFAVAAKDEAAGSDEKKEG